MSYVKTSGLTVVAYPYTYNMLRNEYPATSFPPETDALMASYSAYPVVATPYPAYDPALQRIEEGLPVYSAPNWVQVWNVVALTLPEQAEYKTQFIAAAKQQTVSYIDSFASSRDYLTADRCVSYAASTEPQLAADAAYMTQARDDVVATAYTVFADIQANVIPVPTMDAFLAMLPALAWPNPETWPAVNGTGVL